MGSVQDEKRQIEAKAYHKKQRKLEGAAAAYSERWYERNGDKVVQKTKTPDGNIYSVWVGHAKDCGHLVKPQRSAIERLGEHLEEKAKPAQRRKQLQKQAEEIDI